MRPLRLPHPATPGLGRSVRRVLAAQAVLALLLAALMLLATAVWQGPAALATLGLARAKAAAFGSLLGILATVATARSVLKSSRAAEENPHLALLPVYSGLLLKLLIVAGGAFVGMVYWRFGPFPVALGYLTVQAGYAWAATASGVAEGAQVSAVSKGAPKKRRRAR